MMLMSSLRIKSPTMFGVFVMSFAALLQDQSCFVTKMSHGNVSTFEVDHLATYTIKSGMTSIDDSLNKLKQMENSTGIWTKRCLLIVEPGHIVISDIYGAYDIVDEILAAKGRKDGGILVSTEKRIPNALGRPAPEPSTTPTASTV